jgi:aldehyde dehydrogenase (NAD+)
VAQRLQVGTAWVNHHLHFGPHIPLVGAKESGVGVEFGTEGLAEYAQLSVINIARQQAA